MITFYCLKFLKVALLLLNVKRALRIFLIMVVTNCSEEKSFSALKWGKNFLRFTLRQG